MTERLRRAGLRPISPTVDITNYVLLELGQPMHAFDDDRLEGEIVVRRAHEKERLTLLTEAEVELLTPEEGVSPGQACVFYETGGTRILGGGWIWRGR